VFETCIHNKLEKISLALIYIITELYAIFFHMKFRSIAPIAPAPALYQMALAITCTVLPTNCFVSTTVTKISMKCVVNWIPLRIRVRSRNAQPHLWPIKSEEEDPPRVPGLPIRDCARGCNNRTHTRLQLSAIDVTEKTFFERLYLVPGMGTFGP